MNDEKNNYQKNYAHIHKDVTRIVTHMTVRVDFLSKFGLIRYGKSNSTFYNIGDALAKRILALIQFKGKIEWKDCNGIFLKTEAKK